MIINATAYRAMLSQLNAKKRHLLKLKAQLRAMDLESAAVDRVLLPLTKTYQEMEVLTQQYKPSGRCIKLKKPGRKKPR